MDKNAMIAQQLGISHERLRLCVADLADEDAGRVHAGLLAPIVWQLGHVALVDAGFVQKAGGTCTIPPRFDELFRAGSGGAADYPPLADVWAAFDAAHEALLEVARTVDGATPVDGRGRYHNVGEMLIFCTYHRGYHVGKITTLRALLGKPRLFG
ncbi:MAG TPA: DinB family protein [bacterium]|nr:DinB family protein [bacterium]